MNKKWFPVALCVAFIFFWEIYIIRPETQKQLALQQKIQLQKQANVVAQNPGAAPSTPKKSADLAAATSPSLAIITEEQRARATTLSLSSERSVKIFQNGSIGSALFNDYKVRGKKSADSVLLLVEGFRWSSTDPKVEECFSKLQKSDASDTSTFMASVGSARCQLSYTSVADRPGLLSTKLSLTGFAESPGTIEFRGVDSLGDGPTADHHYLNFKIEGSKKSVRDKSLLKPDPADMVRKGSVDWLAWGDKYFTAILIPKKESGSFNPNIVYGPASADGQKASFGFQYPIVAKANAESVYEFDLYFGTRDSDELTRISPSLGEAVDLGFFGSVAKLMLWALKNLYNIFRNFGVSIIVLTVLVRMAFWPLNRKVFDSGQKMKALQPEIDRLKAKYAGDKSKAAQMNQELIALYKQYKVNPMGSCLPLLMQMPIFLGLYGALNHSLDLYQAPFFGWVHDLSSPDPLYIFPALWTITLIAYTRLTPTPQAPSADGQAAPDMTKVMLVMNIFFGFLSKDWPSGLTLYLFVSNLVGITQQLMFKRAAKLQPIQEGA